MKTRAKHLGLLVIALGLIALVIGAVFLQQGFSKELWLINNMEQEKIEMPGQPGIIVNSAALAQEAGDTVREHRRNIAPTYGELLDGGRYDPTNTTQLSYSQAMNIENYLYLAVTAFGVFMVVKAIGAFMIVTGIALGLPGFAIRKTAS